MASETVTGVLKVLMVKSRKKKSRLDSDAQQATVEVLSAEMPKEVLLRHVEWIDQHAEKIGDAIEKVLKTAAPSKAKQLRKDLRHLSAEILGACMPLVPGDAIVSGSQSASGQQ